MKVVCDTCGTKYSIDDNRVAGKAFKIHCKKCSAVIILRGALAPVTEPVPDAGTWHVVHGGTQVGPIARSELHRLRTTGELDDGSLIWREGFDDWRALGTVDELRDAPPSSVEIAPDTAASPALAPAALRNERNETSVLFTLSNLAKLAAPAPATASAATGTEGSGLLDIRSLARTLAPASERTRRERGSFDDLPVYAPVTFIAPTVLVPGSPRGRDRRLLWALAASLGVLAIVATILVVIVIRGDGASANAAEMPPALPAGSASTATPSATHTSLALVQTVPAPPLAAAVAQAAPTAAAAPAVAQAAPTAAAAPSSRTVAVASRRASARASSAPLITPRVAAPVAPPLQPQRAAESCSEVTCLVNGYADKCCQIYREQAGGNVAPAPLAPSLPDSLDRSAVAAGIAQIDTSGCHDQSSARGNVTASVKVSPAGAVTAVTVKSSPAPELSACVTAAARKATFARTQRGGSFAYVWRI